jgi:glycosyltransferase involved in cell wall biosynthesis
MPVLEAMAAGVPVACSDIPPLREIAGDDVFYFDPTDENAIGDAMVRVLSDASKVEAARRRAAGFTWEKAARETLRVLESQT